MFIFNKKRKELKRQFLRLKKQNEELEDSLRRLAKQSLKYYDTVDALIAFLNLQKYEKDNSKIEIQLKQ